MEFNQAGRPDGVLRSQPPAQGSPKRSEAGFTLIEILISLVLLVGGLVSFVVLTGNVVSNSAENKRNTNAVAMAQEKIEDLRRLFHSRDPDSLTNADNGSDTVDNIYTRTWTISDHPAGNNLSILAVQVDWTGPSGAETVNIRTLLSQ